MSMARWDGLNKGAVIGPFSKYHQGQHYIWFKAGTISVYLTLDETNNLINGLIDHLEEAAKKGAWPPPEPNR